MKNVIEVPENVNFLSEWDGFELPNGIFNKGTTACGATTLALKDKFKTIICSPRNELLKNKHEQHPETLLVIGGCEEQKIIEFIRNNQTPKILVSYDSFPKVARCIENNSDWRIVVDEFQYMLSDSGMKSPIELRLMETLKDFPYVTYMSATPIIEKYINKISWFKSMDYTELLWSNVEKIKLIRQEAKRPIDAAVEIVRMYQSGNFPFLEIEGKKVESKECVIYLNSVNNIVNIIKQTGLKPDEVNIIVGGNQDNDKEIAKIGKGFKRGRIPLKAEPHKMFTFCTSTAFAGCDFYSTCASSFVISDSKRIQTSVDIATDLVQIAGRQRLSKNPFRKILTFVYRCNNGKLSEIEFTEIMEKKKKVSKLEILDYNNITDIDYKEKKN